MAAPNLVADFLLCESRERGEILTNLKLQKLLYYAQAWYLALHGKELFSEDFEAWVHGPVLVSQYRRFKDYEWRPITEAVQRPTLPEGVAEHLLEVIDIFGSETAVSLELMTHAERPWNEARKGVPKGAPSSNRISKDVMREYYRSLAT